MKVDGTQSGSAATVTATGVGSSALLGFIFYFYGRTENKTKRSAKSLPRTWSDEMRRHHDGVGLRQRMRPSRIRNETG